MIEDKERGWSLPVWKEAVYPGTGRTWAWKVEQEYFFSEKGAAGYLQRRIKEKDTGIRMIPHSKMKRPDICGGSTPWIWCRRPGECGSILCMDCPVAEEFFAQRDGVVLKYVDD